MKAAFVAVVGRPSVGKSTLINLICGEKVAIVTAVPQTTRNAIRGIYNSEQGQLVFVDTPGRHDSQRKFNKKLLEVSDRTLDESDLVLYVLDAGRAPGQEETEVAQRVSPLAEKTVIAINKVDSADIDSRKIKDFLSGHLPGILPERLFEISAKNNTGIEPVLSALFALSPDESPFYDQEYYTDQGVDFRISEIIREQAILRLYDELPHSLYVEVADTEFKDAEKMHLWVRAFLMVERESQKGMVVGKGGEKIKAIRLAAEKELNRIFDWKTELDLRVKTGKDWRSKDVTLKKLIG